MPTSTITPTVVLGKFDWDLERVGPVTVVFTDASEGEDIKMTYSISHRTAVIKIFDISCQNLVAQGIVQVSQKTKITSPTHSLLSVNLDINEQSVVTSTIWKDGQTTGEDSSSFAFASTWYWMTLHKQVSISMSKSFICPLD
jgi:hypothetical protein